MKMLEKILFIKDPLKRAKSMCDLLGADEHADAALLPVKSIPYIPEVVLSKRVLPECETYFIQESVEMTQNEISNWNETVDSVLEMLSVEIDLSYPDTDKNKGITEKSIASQIESVLAIEK